jgi:uncharacterized SAM-binding protein YcdF (DUF218 family)
MLPRVTFDALIVLGCRVSGGELAHAALRRVERAAQAYQEDGAALVITSGGKRWQGAMEAEVFAQGLRERGVPDERLLLERESLTTLGNARGVAQLLRDRNAGRLGLVTCDWHMRRAQQLFSWVGLETTALAASSPARALPVRLGRYLRERGSLVLARFAPPWFRA